MNVSEISNLIAALIILLGSLMALISSIGLVRFQDVYTRSHAATKSSTLGVLLTLTGVFIFFFVNDNYFSVRVILGIVFLYITSPVAGHLITRAAYNSGVKMYTKQKGKKGKRLN
ncbi:Na+/H+ antiporter subunit G [Macrococcus carouselicus]|uniref:Na+/H+ antiporter subunit G n=1 Tax=Macrococcus carouselicus TaxID=69969 RepID=A0A9Q8FQT0_9STAP|nr:Na+/H+ antiporter subunit G [Macrococcus carouselicus]TDM04028.1 Na+/H+ antiporter subunit G [Macrococcus carouselicus]